MHEVREGEVLVAELRFKREQLGEKLKQLQLVLKLNDGQLPAAY